MIHLQAATTSAGTHEHPSRDDCGTQQRMCDTNEGSWGKLEREASNWTATLTVCQRMAV